jgi:16S rRNA (adenine1518-N6/adenine1519-N6)-dimethyltransferase
MDVKPGSFRPPPAVMSSVVRIEFSPGHRYPLRNEQVFREVTGTAFRQRRKMVRNTLIPYLAARGVPAENIVPFLGDTGIDPTSRPEDIDVGEWVRLANAITGIR